MSKIYTVIAAGGLGKRLQNYGNSNKTKMLLEINGQSMITKQLNQLISWNLDNFIVITNPRYDKLIKDELSKNMSDLEIQYSLQNEQLGVAHALLQAEKFVPDGAKIIYILGDNFFEFNPLIDLDISKTNASIFLTKVSNPEEFGVVEVVDGEIISIQEKPSKPKSDYIAVGLYLFDNLCFEYIKSIQKSDRGEYEITSLIEKYLDNNALNFLDNMDGLAATTATMIALSLVLLSYLTNQYKLTDISLVLIGSMLGFLYFNLPKARIYMGDSGSLFLGYCLGFISVLFTWNKSIDSSWIFQIQPVILFFTIPLLDFTTVIISRLRTGKSPMTGGTDHISHRLLKKGYSDKAVLLIFVIVSLLILGITLCILLSLIHI